jgi:uncharacterized membrane protein
MASQQRGRHMSATIGSSSAPATFSPSTTPGTVSAPAERIRSIDIMRGVIMVLMAIDHVRVYSGLPAGGATAGIFFTRWITHFCAPGFVFFAGTAAFLHGRKLGDVGQLSRYLLTRGLMLVVLELTLIRFSWTFNVAYDQFVLAGVIWMLGWCMVLLAGLVRLRARTVGLIGVGIICLQQLFAVVPRLLPAAFRPAFGRGWEFIYPAGLEAAPAVQVLYVIVPWIGVMAAGYGFGAIMLREREERNRLCVRIGLGATAAFVVVATVAAILQTGENEARLLLFRILDQQKYPASQLFLLMTLGPMIALLPAAERARGWIARAFDVIGRVPLFFYLLHIPLIHATALLVNRLRTGSTQSDFYDTAPFSFVPEELRWSLGLLYLVFALDVVLLYGACYWYADVKRRRPGSWLRYL